MNNYENDNTIIDAIETEKDTFTTNTKTHKAHPMMKKVGVFVLCGALFGTVAGGAFAGTSYYFGNQVSSTVSQNTATNQSNANLTTYTSNKVATTSSSSDTQSVANIAANCMPSIVAITNIGVTDVMTYWGTTQTESESCGSGVIIGQTDDELLIVTNYHVIEGNNTLTVVFSYDEKNEEPQAVEAYAKGYDEDKDLAVIAISMDNITEEMAKQISVATVGSSDDLVLGEEVVAIGNALGYGQSVTTGIVSALDRQITSSEDSSTENEYIQTDAAINPGNSGGALFNLSGQLVGINSAKIASDGVEGMGYAIPISDVYDLIEEMMNETVRTEVVAENERGYLGMTGADVTLAISNAYGYPEGIYINAVSEGAALDKAGITTGSVITKFDGKNVRSISNLQTLLTYYKAGETITITVAVKDGSSYTEKDINVTLSSKDDVGTTTSNSTMDSNENSNANAQTYSNPYSNLYGNYR